MNSEITIKVEGRAFKLPRKRLLEESENQQLHANTNFVLTLPQWATIEAYGLVEKYVLSKEVEFLAGCIHNNQLVVKVMRIGDYLGMGKFQDAVISKILIPKISANNCIVFLEESQKKLKNSENSQCWLNLLNLSINYLSSHIFQIAKLQLDNLKKLNDKILHEVFHLVIKAEKKNGFPHKDQLFKLIIECQGNSIEANLFRNLNLSVKNKKIHAAIHAKLSWKLENVSEIHEKRTKNFKFLDMGWFLNARRNTEGLQITLNLLNSQICEGSIHTASRFSSNETDNGKSEKSQSNYKSEKNQLESLQNFQKKHDLDIFTNDQFTKMVIFYSKLVLKTKQHTTAKQTRLHYILINQPQPLNIFTFDEQISKSIGKSRVELTIFCNMDQIYTFCFNYVLYYHDKLSFKGSYFQKQELQAFIKGAKRIKNYSQALKLTNELFLTSPLEREKPEYSIGYDFADMSKFQLELYSKILGKPFEYESRFMKQKVVVPKKIPPQNMVFDFENRSAIQSVGLKNRIQKKFDQSWDGLMKPPSSHFSEKDMTSSKTDSRAGSKRKIFTRPQPQIQPILKIAEKSLMEQMMGVTDFRRYLKPKSENPIKDKVVQYLSQDDKLPLRSFPFTG